MSAFRGMTNADTMILRCRYCAESRNSFLKIQVHYVEAHPLSEEAELAIDAGIAATERLS